MQKRRVIELVGQGSPDKAFRISEVECAELKADYVRISVEASGINFAEVLQRLGLYPEAPKSPFVPGYEIVGRISEIGNNVKNVKVGDRVVAGTMFGGYASEVCIPEFYAIKIKNDLEAGVALSLVTQGQTAVHLFESALQVYPDDLVLIHAAAGGVGTLLCQLAIDRGCEVIGTCGSNEKAVFLKNMGVQHVINYRAMDFTKEVKNRFGKRRVDVCFDSIGGTTLRKSYEMLGAGGRLACYGLAQAVGQQSRIPMLQATLNQLNTKLVMAQAMITTGLVHPLSLLARSKSIAGVNMFQLMKHKPQMSRRAFERAHELLQKSVLKPHVGAMYPAEQIARAHDLLENRLSIGKVAIRWQAA